jgi:hypothetical protein
MFSYIGSVGGVDLLGYNSQNWPSPACDKESECRVDAAPRFVPSVDQVLRESGINDREQQLQEVGSYSCAHSLVMSHFLAALREACDKRAAYEQRNERFSVGAEEFSTLVIVHWLSQLYNCSYCVS